MPPQFEVNVTRGRLVPGAEVIRSIVDTLRSDIEQDATLRARFDLNPRGVLGDRGILRDLQNEILSEQGRSVPAEDCDATCVSTGSCCCDTI
jgi:hypothetical protein